MPIEIQKEITTKSSDPVSDQVSQTSTVTQAATDTERQDAHSDRSNAWIWYIIGVIDLMLLLRLLFHLFGARAAGFTDFLYAITSPFVAPFRGIFASPRVEGSYFDTASLVAIVIYALLGWMIVGLIDLATRPTDSKKM